MSQYLVSPNSKLVRPLFAVIITFFSPTLLAYLFCHAAQKLGNNYATGGSRKRKKKLGLNFLFEQSEREKNEEKQPQTEKNHKWLTHKHAHEPLVLTAVEEQLRTWACMPTWNVRPRRVDDARASRSVGICVWRCFIYSHAHAHAHIKLISSETGRPFGWKLDRRRASSGLYATSVTFAGAQMPIGGLYI